MGDYRELRRRAEDRGVVLRGINPLKIRGCGIGVVTARKLTEGKVILKVPTKALCSLYTVSVVILSKPPHDSPFHGILAANIALDTTTALEPWETTLPSLLADFEATTPYYWLLEFQDLLPKPAKDILKKKQFHFQHHWNIVSKVFPQVRLEDYLYSWFLANTPTFYYETPEMEKYNWEDRLALLPIAELFNHADGNVR
ncbi:uncharacterized protein BCR38DRAFT_328743, partial [Pseudomassariella vexata]